jgi:hypothetical protein
MAVVCGVLGFSCLFLFLSVESYRGSCKSGGFSSSSSFLQQVLSYEHLAFKEGVIFGSVVWDERLYVMQ